MNRFDNDYMDKFDKLIKFLIESKVRIGFSLIVLLFAVIGSFIFSNHIIRLFESQIPFKVDLLQMYVHEIFLNDLKIGFLLGLFISLPFLIYQFSKLKIKNLTLENKSGIIKILSCFVLAALLGSLASFYILIPAQIFLLLGLNQDVSLLTLNVSAYVSFCLVNIVITTLLFSIPVIFFLAKKGEFSSYEILKKHKKTAFYISCTLVFLIISPPEIIAFLLLSALLYIFYLIILFIVKKVENNGI